MKLKYTILALILSIFTTNMSSQIADAKKMVDINLLLGINIGATSPIPIPAEVRKINSYGPKFNPQLGVELVYNLKDNWGVGIGASLDWKGMRVTDEVKYMYTSVTLAEGSDKLTGYFVGKNMTNVNMTYLTVPIYATYNFNNQWRMKLGIYAARALSSKFNGSVSDGYIRIDTPVGQKQDIEGSGATFDFSKDIRDYDLGAMLGGEFRLTDRIGFYGNLQWGFVPFFYSKTNPIEFKMYNIYGTIGITYRYR